MPDILQLNLMLTLNISNSNRMGVVHTATHSSPAHKLEQHNGVTLQPRPHATPSTSDDNHHEYNP
jgi:hypothetical protein